MTSPRVRPGRPDNTGVTLVELMVVLVIVAIGFLTLRGVQTRSSRDVTATGFRSRALGVGQVQMEIARAAGFNGAQTDSGAADAFNWRTDVEPVSPGLNRVRVTVTWTEEVTARSLQLNSLVSAR